MKKNINKFKKNSSSNSIILLIILFFILLITSYFFFQSYKTILIKKTAHLYELNISDLNSKFDKYIETYKKKDILKAIEKSISSKLFESIKLKNNRYIFTNNTLFENTLNLDDKSWEVVEVVIDAKYGYINKIPKTNLYEFIPSREFNLFEPINIRYQVYKKGIIKNIFTKIDFSNIELENKENKSQSSFIDLFYTLPTPNKTYELKADNIIVSNVVYVYNNNILREDLRHFLFELILLNIILFSPVLFVLFFYHKYLFKKYVTEPVTYVNKYLDDILNSKFGVLEKNRFEGTKELKELTKKVMKVSTKIASLKNEINVNKESLELKSSTDGLTGLPNKNIFDFDIKTMFVGHITGYIFIIKIDNLSEISKDHDSGYINNFIESYTNSIRNVIFKFSKTDMKLYRFYGSQFAVIAKNIDLTTAKQMCENIIREITDILPDIYDVPDDLIHIGGSAFDLYGSLDTIMNSIEKAYIISKEKGNNSYHIIGDTEIEKNYSLLENSVSEVISKANFSVHYILDSFLFDEPEKLVMNEASPQLYDHDNKKLPIGSFVAVAQKLNLVDTFDKLVIQRVIKDIREKEFNHEIAINLSISSLGNEQFISWLRELLDLNEDIKKYIVFSVTSYTAYLHRNTFVNFIKQVHTMGAKVLLKRYKIDEYPLAQLEYLELDYIRMNQNYTTNFTSDIVKKHKVKNILIFAELNNIKVIADSVKLDADYDLLERLGTYATSK